ncbi:MAG TPA: DUF4159 domain-containing protein [Parvularculaceae bacterium]|nr:DUF4159 domain-containing protein [Caulobacterales bacterium]HPE31832.1 DUF4159 domain-containing protein [Parvularculaceae bacterium]HRX37942.1 DUF4159 domain-containing protein [Parvularculaceae bacterium]
MLTLGALSFAEPLILMSLLALPAIWLLLRATPPAPQRVKFPAFIILRDLAGTEETPDKTPWWVLLLRLLLAAIVILALAGPILNAPKLSGATGPLVFVVDDSWAAAPGWRIRQNALKAGAEEAAQAGRSVFILKTSEPDAASAATPLTGEEALGVSDAIKPSPFRADRQASLASLAALDAALGKTGGQPEIRWLTDGVAENGDAAFAAALGERGALTVFADTRTQQMILRALAPTADGRVYRVERLADDTDWTGQLIATARDGRILATTNAEMKRGEKSIDVAIDLPLALRNDIASVAIEGYSSAGAVQLADARDRRAAIGLIAGSDDEAEALLTGGYYVKKALEPYAAFESDTLENLLRSDVSVIVLDDVGRLRANDVAGLQAWVEKGGVIIRFAGPNLADAAQDGDPPLLPVSLRGGGRAFGGALTWETPQLLGPFSPDGPFADLAPPTDVFVRQQVLARPGGETSERTWASLADGTPLVTGVNIGAGAVALFHVPATPGWSDLPISAIFVDMLRKLTFLSVLGPDRAEGEASARLAPIRVLDGFGRLEKPAPDLQSITAAEAQKGAAPGRPPGLYGAPEAPLAVNAVGPADAFAPLSITGVPTTPYVAEPPKRLAPPLFAIALLLLLADALLTLFLAGRLRFAGAALLALALFSPIDPSHAQPLDAPIDAKAEEAALHTRLAYVITGDPEVDRLSERGLYALSRELIRRTAIEPAAPAGIDPETDDLSVYSLLYWPIVAGASAPGEAALANIENFMRFGGLIVFDTRDDERAVAGLETPERAALREILSQVDIPPLATLPKDHVLTRSFYLLEDLPGRMRNNPVWVQAAGGANDGVTPLIIGGRDWAGAWAADDYGRPMRPMSRGGERERELAYRAGINIVMVAYTGNYKSDQVHTPILLERLGH